MIEYSCLVSLSLDEAVRRLKAGSHKHEVIDECTLGFRKKPTRAVKQILLECGFVNEPAADAPMSEKLEALQAKYSS